MKELVIVGCGTLGSVLSHLLVLKNKDIGNIVKKITLIDNDIIESKNIPYLFIDSSSPLINTPKSVALKYQLDLLSTDTNIISVYDDFKNVSLSNNRSYIIDCRDEPDEQSIFKLKLCLDGDMGRIILNPKTKNSTIKKSNYTFDRKYFTPYEFASYVCTKFIFNKISLKKKRYEFIIDLRCGTIQHELCNVKPIKYSSS
jgi:hypothetical protein